MTKNLSGLYPSPKHAQPETALARTNSIDCTLHPPHHSHHRCKQQPHQCNTKPMVHPEHIKSQFTRFRGHFILDKSHEPIGGNRDQSLMEASINCLDFEDTCSIAYNAHVTKANEQSRYRIRLEYEFDPTVRKQDGYGLTSVEFLSPSVDGKPSTLLTELKPVLRSIVDKLVETHHTQAMTRKETTTKRHCTSHGRSKSVDVAPLKTGLSNTTSTVPSCQTSHVCESQTALTTDRVSGITSPRHHVLQPEVIGGNNIPSPVIADYQNKQQQQLLVRTSPTNFKAIPCPERKNSSGEPAEMSEMNCMQPYNLAISPLSNGSGNDDCDLNFHRKPLKIDERNGIETTCCSVRASVGGFVAVTNHKEIPWYCLRNTNGIFDRTICSTRRVFGGAVYVPVTRNLLCTFGSSNIMTVIRPVLYEVTQNTHKRNRTRGKPQSISKDKTRKALENTPLISIGFNGLKMRRVLDAQTNHPLLLASNQIRESRAGEVFTRSVRSSDRSLLGSRSLDRLSQARSYGVPPLVTPSAVHNVILPLNPINYFTDHERAMYSARANLFSTSESHKPVNTQWGHPGCTSSRHRERLLIQNQKCPNKRAKNVSPSSVSCDGIQIFPVTQAISLEASATGNNGNKSTLLNTLGCNNNSACRKAQSIVFQCDCGNRRIRSRELCKRCWRRHRTDFCTRFCQCARHKQHLRQRTHNCFREISLANEHFIILDMQCRPQRYSGCCCANAFFSPYKSVEVPVVYLDLSPGQYALHKCTCNAQLSNKKPEDAPVDEITKPVLDPLPELSVKVDNNSAVTSNHHLAQTVLVDCDWGHDVGQRTIKHDSPHSFLYDASVLTPACTYTRSASYSCPTDGNVTIYARDEMLYITGNLITLELPLLFKNTNTCTIYYPNYCPRAMQYYAHCECQNRNLFRNRLWFHNYGSFLSGHIRPVTKLPRRKKVRKFKRYIYGCRNRSGLKRRSPKGRYPLTTQENSRNSLGLFVSSFKEYPQTNSQESSHPRGPTLMPCTSPTRKCLAEEGGFYFFLSSPDSISALNSEMANHKVQLPESTLQSTSHQPHVFSAVCPVIVNDVQTTSSDDPSNIPTETNNDEVFLSEVYQKSRSPAHCTKETQTGIVHIAENRQLRSGALEYPSPIDIAVDKPNCSPLVKKDQFVAISGIATNVQPCEILVDMQLQTHLPSEKEKSTTSDQILLDISCKYEQCKHLQETDANKREDVHLAEIRCEAQALALSPLGDLKNLSLSDFTGGASQTSHYKLMHTVSQVCHQTTISFSECRNDNLRTPLPLKTVSPCTQQSQPLFNSHPVDNRSVQMIDTQNQQQPLLQSNETSLPCPMELCVFVQPAANPTQTPEDESIRMTYTVDETSESIDYNMFTGTRAQAGQLRSSESVTRLSTPTNLQNFGEWSSMTLASPSLLLDELSPRIQRFKMEFTGESNETNVWCNQSKSALNDINYSVENKSKQLSSDEFKWSQNSLRQETPVTDPQNYPTTDPINASLIPMPETNKRRGGARSKVVQSQPLEVSNTSKDSDCSTENEPSTELETFPKTHTSCSEPLYSVEICMETQTDLSRSYVQSEELATCSFKSKQALNNRAWGKKLWSMCGSAVKPVKSDRAFFKQKQQGVSSSLATVRSTKHSTKGDERFRKRYGTSDAQFRDRILHNPHNKAIHFRMSRSITGHSNVEKRKYLRRLPPLKRFNYFIDDHPTRKLSQTTFSPHSNMTEHTTALGLFKKCPLISSESPKNKSHWEVFDTNNSNSSQINSGDLWMSENMCAPQASTLITRDRCLTVDNVPQLRLSFSSSLSLKQSPTVTVKVSRFCETGCAQLTDVQNVGFLTTGIQLMPISNVDTRLSKSMSDSPPNSVSDCYYNLEGLTTEVDANDPCLKDTSDLEESSCSVHLDSFDHTNDDSSSLFMGRASCKSAPCYFWYLNSETWWCPNKYMTIFPYTPDELDNYETSSQVFDDEQTNPKSLSYSASQSLNTSMDYSEAVPIISPTSSLNTHVSIISSQELMSTPAALLDHVEKLDLIQKLGPHSKYSDVEFAASCGVIHSPIGVNLEVYDDQHSGSVVREHHMQDNPCPSNPTHSKLSSCVVNFKQHMEVANQVIEFSLLTEGIVLSESVQTFPVRQMHCLVFEISLKVNSSFLLTYTQEWIYSTECLTMNCFVKGLSVKPPYFYECTLVKQTFTLLHGVEAIAPLQRIYPDFFTSIIAWNEAVPKRVLFTFIMLNAQTTRPKIHTVTQYISEACWFQRLDQLLAIADQQVETYLMISPVWFSPRYGPQHKQRKKLRFSRKVLQNTVLSALAHGQTPWQLIQQPWYPKTLMWQARMDCLPYLSEQLPQTSTLIDPANSSLYKGRRMKICDQRERNRGKSISLINPVRDTSLNDSHIFGSPKVQKRSISSVLNYHMISSGDYESSGTKRCVTSPRLRNSKLRIVTGRSRKVNQRHVPKSRKQMNRCTVLGEPGFVQDKQGSHIGTKHNVSAGPKSVDSDDFFEAIDRQYELMKQCQSKLQPFKDKATVACQTPGRFRF